MKDKTRPDPIQAPLLERMAGRGIRHRFFTRQGGVSSGIYEGLNIGIGSQDDQALVAENRRRVAAWFGAEPQQLASLYQVHSADALIIDGPVSAPRPQADALVTNVPGLVLGIATADCGPVLFADPDARVIGAAHAGWKGALTGVLDDTITKMESLGAERSRICAVLGPCISKANYEVGPEFMARFVADDAANKSFFSPSADKPSHAFFDLNTYIRERLGRLGVDAQILERCTYAEENLFYSYRRTTHRNEPDYGRQISAIMLEDN